MPQPARRPKFWRYVAHGLFWMAVCEGIHLGLQQTSFYERMVNANLDALLASRNVSVSPNVFVIWVTEDDYRNPGLFAGASPLKQPRPPALCLPPCSRDCLRRAFIQSEMLKAFLWACKSVARDSSTS